MVLGVIVGYARVSTGDQDTALQLDALHAAGAGRVFVESGSGVGPRPELQRAIQSVRSGDILTVWKVDRVARSLGDLLSILGRLRSSSASIRSLTEPIDTSTPIGEFTFQILGAVAQLERSMIRERVMAGQAAARARGKTWGRRRVFSDQESMAIAAMWRGGWCEQAQIADMFGVPTATVRDAIHKVEKRGRYRALTLQQ